ncbi:tetratricopeptide repeat protein [Planctomicrobium sp. SH527]|uniref:tetratricopeptide repeat protein n=1 Tax=Planctomicrobium sp. SH527 TaxID=3448123 RepID=UPI003F5B19B1
MPVSASKIEETISRGRRALKANPGDVQLHEMMADLYERLGRHQEAGTHLAFLLSQTLSPDEALYVRYAKALQRAGLFHQAQALLDEALRHFPTSIRLQRNKAITFVLMQEFKRAEELYRELAERDASDAHSAGLVGTLQFLLSDMQDGYAQYALRPLDRALSRLLESVIRWNGEPLNGKRVVVWSEQGIGDAIMFLSLLPWVTAKASAVTVVVTAKLAPLVARAFPEVEIVSEEGLKAIGTQFDYHVLMGDLLQHALRDYTPGMHPPFLVADMQRAGALRHAYLAQARERGREKLIGLAWHTTNPEVGFTRNISLSELQPILSVPGIQFVSLQYGEHTEEIVECNRRCRDAIFVDPAIDAFNDIDGLAAQMAALDGVITIDNATVHLAGALGVPTTLLLCAVPDWRWGLQGNNSRWYRSVHLERQEALSKWKPAIQRVRKRLMDGAQ